MSLETVFEALQDPGASPPATLLAQLSDLSEEDALRFASIFPILSIQRRRELIDMLAELEEDSVELTFGSVFSLGLDDPDVQVRSQSIQALWEDESPAFARKLIAMLNDEEALVRGEAARALGTFILRDELSPEENSAASEVESALREIYYDERQIVEVRGRALEALGARSLDWVHDLIDEAYHSGERRLAISAVNAMGRSADPAWLPVLFDEMLSEDSEMRFEAAQAAGELGDDEAVPQLAQLVADEDPEVQEAAINALGSIGGPAAKDVLQSIATEYDDERILEAVSDAMMQAEFLDDPMAFKLYLDGATADDAGMDASEDEE